MCEILETAGPEAVTLEDAGDDPQLEPAPGATPLWPRIRVRALYARCGARDAVRTMLRVTPEVTDLRTREIADRDWLAASRENIEPLAIGSLWIGPHGIDPTAGSLRRAPGAGTRFRLPGVTRPRACASSGWSRRG